MRRRAASAILASSSSAIVTSRFTEKLKGRERCLVATRSILRTWCRSSSCPARPGPRPRRSRERARSTTSVGQVPIVVKKEIDGFILNRMQAVLLSEAMRLVGEGYVSAEDLDKTIRDGLGLRWSFMGPFETIELNAPGGIPDYCARFGAVFAELASKPVTSELWGKENVGRAVASWGHSPSPQEILDKQRWRDERLAALIAHKRDQAAPAE